MNNTLPDGYTKIEYIKSAGGQYVDTGVITNDNTRVVLDFAVVSSSTSISTLAEIPDPSKPPIDLDIGVSIFGSRADSNSIKQFSFEYVEGKGFTSKYMNQESTITVANETKRMIVDKNKNVTTLDGISVAETAETGIDNVSLALCAINQTTGPTAFSAIKIYSCQIYDNDTLVRDFTPCLNSEKNAGLLDLINNVFYPSLGEKNFIAGGEFLGSVARKVKNIYVGVKIQVPIKETTTVTTSVPLTLENLSNFFFILYWDFS